MIKKILTLALFLPLFTLAQNKNITYNQTNDKSLGLINSFEIKSDNHLVGVIGKINPIFNNEMRLDIGEVYGFQINLDLLIELAAVTTLFNKIVTYPHVERDLNFVFKENILIGDLVSTIIENGNDILKSVATKYLSLPPS